MNVCDKFLITTDGWFFAPDGRQYRAVHGTVKGILDSQEALGIKTNARSTNWYVEIGDCIIAGCQIHYAIKCDEVSYDPDDKIEIDHNGERFVTKNATTRIYNADWRI